MSHGEALDFTRWHDDERASTRPVGPDPGPYSETDSDTEPAPPDVAPLEMSDCVPILLAHRLEQVNAACVQLTLLESMWRHPDAFLAALHLLCPGVARHAPVRTVSTWSSVLSSEDLLQGNRYTALVQQLFITPFTDHDAFRIQGVLVKQLTDDLTYMKESILPHAKDNELRTLRDLSIVVDAALVKLKFTTGIVPHRCMYRWGDGKMLEGLEYMNHEAIRQNRRSEFGYNGIKPDLSVYDRFMNDAQELCDADDPARFASHGAVEILRLPAADLDYESRLLRGPSPRSALYAKKYVDGLFTRGTNHRLALPTCKCTANVQRLDAGTSELASDCYNLMLGNDVTATAAADALLRTALAPMLPGVHEVEVRALRGVRGVSTLALSLAFAGSLESGCGARNLFTYVTIPVQHGANSGEHRVELLSIRTEPRTDDHKVFRMLNPADFVDMVLDAIPARETGPSTVTI